jgi:hypothetical protein
MDQSLTALPAGPTSPRPDAGGSRRHDRLRGASLGVGLTMAGIFWLVLFHAAIGGHEEHEPPLLVHGLRDGALALPGTVAAVIAALWLSRRWSHRRGVDPRRQRAVNAVLTALAAAAALAVGGPVHERLFGAEDPVELPLPLDMGRDALVALVVLLPVAWLLSPGARAGSTPRLSASPVMRRPGQTPAAVWLLVLTLTAAGLLASAVVTAALDAAG